MLGELTTRSRSARRISLLSGLVTLAAVVSPGAVHASVRNVHAKHPSAAAIRDRQGSGVQFDHGKTTINRQPVTPTQTIQKASEMLQGRGGFPMLLATAERMRLERSFPGKVMDWTRQAEPRASSHTLSIGSAHTEEWTSRDAHPAGDLNGDGLADVIGYETTVRYTDDGLITSTYEILVATVTARQGSNGTMLWQRDLLADGQNPYDTLLVPFGKDVTGDGKADILERSFAVHSDKPAPCAILVCAGQGSSSYSWTTRVLDGANGRAVWSQVLDGDANYTEAFAYGFVAIASVDTFSARNYLVDTNEAGDLDGDGLSDLVSNAYSVTGDDGLAGVGALGSSVFVSVFDSRDTTHMQALAGRSGEALLTRNVEIHNGLASALPVGDATGDGRADLLWSETSWEASAHGATVCVRSRRLASPVCERPGYDPRSTLSLLAAPSFSAAWSVNAPEVYGSLETSIGDLNGDGGQDLGFLGDNSSYAVDGKTGAVMWNQPYDGFYLDPLANIGPVGGSPGDDLLRMFYTNDGNGGGILAVDRIDGATGQLLFTTEHADPVSPNYGYVAGFVYGDADGDGTTDVGIRTLIENFPTPSVSTLAVESGRTGITLATASKSNAEYETYTPIGDLNGDGLADVIRSHGEYDYDARAESTTALVMPSLTPLWTRTDPQVDFSGLQPMPNLDGTAGNDVLYSRTGPYDQNAFANSPNRYDLLRGTTGEALWGEGNPFPGTGVENPGSITGSVTASGTAAADVCITAVSSTGEIGFRRTKTDGTYSIDHLPPGAYTVAFNNCEQSRYKPQWYPDASDEQSAIPVAVAAGLVTQGIDAALALKPAPANDNAANAILLQYLDSAQQEIGGATLEAGEPNCGGDATVWYRYTAAGPQAPIFINLSGDFAKTLGVIDGAAAFDSDPIPCAGSDAGQDTQLSILPKGGHTYWIQVGIVGTRGNDMTLTLQPAPRLIH